jgi:hypothetical protein
VQYKHLSTGGLNCLHVQRADIHGHQQAQDYGNSHKNCTLEVRGLATAPNDESGQEQ